MANEPSIEQMNEAIARFMDYKVYDKRYPRNHGIGAPEAEPEKSMIIQKAKYHTSWDWLMPAVEKIETVDVKDGKLFRSAADIKIFYQACIIKYEPDEDSGDPCEEETTIQTQGKNKLEAVYKAVYQFITWFNQQKQNDE